MPGKLFSRSLMMAHIKILSINPDWNATFSLPREALEVLEWWAEELKKWNEKSFLPPAPSGIATTDASDGEPGLETESHH
ncbi:uncharacterized protein VTP21DRAFT_1118 [Calcarisporiella thermophila]|uniref:uncharacterized protein n=1 Tax=Calcarisporiella thermophila TaxID=911321 RepID=UPI00374286A6